MYISHFVIPNGHVGVKWEEKGTYLSALIILCFSFCVLRTNYFT